MRCGTESSTICGITSPNRSHEAALDHCLDLCSSRGGHPAQHPVSGEDWEKDWEATAPLYRLWLYDQGQTTDVVNEEGVIRPARRGFSSAEVEAERGRGGRLPLRQVIRVRVRYFSDGAVLGGAAFVEKVFARHRERFGLKRRTGARPMQEADWEGLCVLRDLKRDRIG